MAFLARDRGNGTNFMETNKGLVVNKTFIDFVDTASRKEMGGLGFRKVCSDSALYENCAKGQPEIADDIEVDFDLTGLSDAESEGHQEPKCTAVRSRSQDAEPGRGRGSHSHAARAAQGWGSITCSTCSTEIPERDGEAIQGLNTAQALRLFKQSPVYLHSNEPSPKSSPNLQPADALKDCPPLNIDISTPVFIPSRESSPRGSIAGDPLKLPIEPQTDQMECLRSDNERLALENRLLRENMLLVMENKRLAAEAQASVGAAAASSARPQQAGRFEHASPAAPCMPTWWNACGSGDMPLGVPYNYLQQANNQANAAPTFVPGVHPEAIWASAPSSMPAPARNKVGGAKIPKPARNEAHGAVAEVDQEIDVPEAERTTVMWRNLPNNYSRAMLLATLDGVGFGGMYDFLYLPIDFKTRACLGYAFINLVSPSVAVGFWRTFDGYSKWMIPSKKVSIVSWSGPHQGFEAHVERYRNSPVMHDTVPDEYKPVVYVSGVRMAFPTSTKTPRAPRVRHSQKTANNNKDGARPAKPVKAS